MKTSEEMIAAPVPEELETPPVSGAAKSSREPMSPHTRRQKDRDLIGELLKEPHFPRMTLMLGQYAAKVDHAGKNKQQHIVNMNLFSKVAKQLTVSSGSPDKTSSQGSLLKAAGVAKKPAAAAAPKAAAKGKTAPKVPAKAAATSGGLKVKKASLCPPCPYKQ